MTANLSRPLSLFTHIAAMVAFAGFCPELQAAEEPASEFIFPFHDQHNHAPGIAELEGGELIVSWYRGTGERKSDDVAVYGARLKPGASKWSNPFLMIDTPGFPDCNTAMMSDANGRLWLFWPVILANTWESCLTQAVVSDAPGGDGCPKWAQRQSLFLKPDDFSAEANRVLDEMLASLPTPLPQETLQKIDVARGQLKEKLLQRLGWQPRCKPLILPSGRILLPLYTDTFSIAIMAISDDQGESWYASKPILGFGAIQPTVLRRNDGTLVVYMRENGFTGRIRTSESADDGITWGPVTSAALPNPGSGLDGVRLNDGHWILVYNDTDEGRNRLAVSLSTDEGATWSVTRHLEDQPEGSFHYPCVIQTRDGLIHTVYSYFCASGKTMKHAAFSQEWILKGDAKR
jgi:predicted neuraminidase